MKTKNILHLVSFVLTFAVSVTVAGAVKSFIGIPASEKITNVLTTDISNGFERRINCCYSNISLAEYTDDYVTASENIDISSLPQDFQDAWVKHLKAWRNHANYLNEKRFSESFKPDYDALSVGQTNEINRTWYEVINVARQHGAKIPRNAFD